MAVTMTLDGYDLGANFPVYGESIASIKQDEQGVGHKKISITLSGFVEGVGSDQVMSLLRLLDTNVGVNCIAPFTYIDDSVTVHNATDVWVGEINFPEESEYAHNAYGDYSIVLYYFRDATDSTGISCSYGAYSFEKIPQWSREINVARDSHRADIEGSIATIELNGELFASSHSALMAKIEALQDAFQEDRTLTYGDFVQSVKAVSVKIGAGTKINFCDYSITVVYDIGDVISLSCTKEYSRQHSNVRILQRPYCPTNTVEPTSDSGQEIVYNISATGTSLTHARSAIETELALRFSAGGYELEGGKERWNYNEKSISLTVKMYHPIPVLPNLGSV